MRPFFFVPLVARMGRPPLGPLVARTAVRVGSSATRGIAAPR